MLDRLGSFIRELQGCIDSLDTAQLDGSEAMELCGRFAEVERLGAAGRLVAAQRVEATEVWRRGGSRTAADWVARHAGADPERAKDGLETAGRLAIARSWRAELRAGGLSECAGQRHRRCAAVRPEAEERLVEFARRTRCGGCGRNAGCEER